ncbi:hypothetical protein FZW96_11170 [Bacillus sp. BGMRC 2118]|nr:hypothetical protein FZW96_11170 [Bacillus sp. BGMRC 2118]
MNQLFLQKFDELHSKSLFQAYRNKFVISSEPTNFWRRYPDVLERSLRDHKQVINEIKSLNVEKYYFFYFIGSQADAKDRSDVFEATSDQIINALKLDRKVPQDFYVFDDSFSWTIVSCHEPFDEYGPFGKYHYAIIRDS